MKHLVLSLFVSAMADTMSCSVTSQMVSLTIHRDLVAKVPSASITTNEYRWSSSKVPFETTAMISFGCDLWKMNDLTLCSPHWCLSLTTTAVAAGRGSDRLARVTPSKPPRWKSVWPPLDTNHLEFTPHATFPLSGSADAAAAVVGGGAGATSNTFSPVTWL
ncbi:hypothetical protein Pelo_8720 [Pelomyxa schiedti]|nr:hypothetical protein Pelo_8720 [Pelomyxa schiedti]